jgi:UDP-N-acetylglucosamine diphosphorylase / glucose-1-phosphate thymidylyltransferase / UDP-N-acetylgalactosamine diphosphorylase / glucosamine-1-phosphate N-acetyltransferase / galactosamine-1-phosphate N-acetyltransferase
MVEFEGYFSLGRFAYRDLWKEGKPIWDPLLSLNDYLRAQIFRIEIKVPAGVHLDRPELISIGQGTVIEPGVYIQGPCIIGKGCILRHGAYLHGGCITGDRAVIGHATEIKHSILLDESAASHLTYVGDSILGNGVNLGAGVKCANLRLDRVEVSVVLEGTRVRTGLKKFGAILGDRVQIGCNCVLNPGTLVGRDSVSHPLLNFGGTIPPRSRISGENTMKIKPMVTPFLDLVEKARAT